MKFTSGQLPLTSAIQLRYSFFKLKLRHVNNIYLYHKIGRKHRPLKALILLYKAICCSYVTWKNVAKFCTSTIAYGKGRFAVIRCALLKWALVFCFNFGKSRTVNVGNPLHKWHACNMMKIYRFPACYVFVKVHHCKIEELWCNVIESLF